MRPANFSGGIKYRPKSEYRALTSSSSSFSAALSSSRIRRRGWTGCHLFLWDDCAEKRFLLTIGCAYRSASVLVEGLLSCHPGGFFQKPARQVKT